ncbi:MAG: hypothetical protein AAGB04_30725 [Pseudomonadota bacterium]
MTISIESREAFSSWLEGFEGRKRDRICLAVMSRATLRYLPFAMANLQLMRADNNRFTPLPLVWSSMIASHIDCLPKKRPYDLSGEAAHVMGTVSASITNSINYDDFSHDAEINAGRAIKNLATAVASFRDGTFASEDSSVYSDRCLGSLELTVQAADHDDNKKALWTELSADCQAIDAATTSFKLGPLWSDKSPHAQQFAKTLTQFETRTLASLSPGMKDEIELSFSLLRDWYETFLLGDLHDEGRIREFLRIEPYLWVHTEHLDKLLRAISATVSRLDFDFTSEIGTAKPQQHHEHSRDFFDQLRELDGLLESLKRHIREINNPERLTNDLRLVRSYAASIQEFLDLHSGLSVGDVPEEVKSGMLNSLRKVNWVHFSDQAQKWVARIIELVSKF